MDRFWKRVNKGPGLGPKGDCWEWNGPYDKDGYGDFWFDGKVRPAHRVAWFIQTGVWPENLCCHHCDNPRCVRLDHLFDGTHADNMQDSKLKGRQNSPWAVNSRKTHCKYGHLFTPETTRVGKNSNGSTYRRCIVCDHEQCAAYKRKVNDELPYRLISEC